MMISEEIISRGGSKLEITRALIESGIDIPIPNATWKYYGAGLDSLLKDFANMRKPVIVRGSHKNDYHGFIDVVPTFGDVNTASKLEKVIGYIEQALLQNDMKIHCDDWNQEYSPEVHILMQEQSASPIVGSMLRHPNDKKQLRIQYISNECPGAATSFAEITRRGFHHNPGIGWEGEKVTDDEIHELIEMYEKLERCKILDPEWSYQMEFGLKPLLFYQARPFKKFEPAKDFKLPSIKGAPYIRASDYFGLTPKEGVDLDFVTAGIGNFCDVGEPFYENNKPYGMIRLYKERHSYSTEKRIGALSVFCSPCSPYDFLFHGNYRLMKKADISFVYFHVDNLVPGFSETPHPFANCSFEAAKEFAHSRVWCNGERGIIIPTKYL